MAIDHYIPQFLLRNWSDNKTSIWTYSTSDGLKRHKIKNWFGEKNLTAYKSVDFSNRSSRSSNPRTFQQSVKYDSKRYDNNLIKPLESNAARIINCMIDQVQGGHRLIGTSHDALILQLFLFLMIRRTPESQMRWFNDEWTTRADHVALDTLNRKLQDSNEHPFFHSLDDLFAYCPNAEEFRDLARSNALAQFAAGATQELKTEIERFCNETGFLICTTKCTRRRLIMGSYGHSLVLVRTSTGYTKSAVFPLSPELAIAIKGNSNSYDVGEIDSHMVHQTNIAMAENSHTILAATEEQVLKYKKYIK